MLGISFEFYHHHQLELRERELGIFQTLVVSMYIVTTFLKGCIVQPSTPIPGICTKESWTSLRRCRYRDVQQSIYN